MTQLDLPQLSLERYVDLVRRRRWQLVPVSLLGLVVGGLVAFFIPRYYVAEVLVEHRAAPSQLDLRGDDPFRPVVDNAQETILLAAGDAMRALRWPEAAVVDPSERTANEREVQDRIELFDKNAGQRDRAYALLRLSYRDRDRGRAAVFADTLVDTWIAQQIEGMRAPAEIEWQRAKDAAAQAERTHEEISRDKHALERRYGIRPDFTLEAQSATYAAEVRAQQELAEQLRKRIVERDQLADRVTTLRERLAVLPERLPPDPAHLLEIAKGNPVLEPLILAHEQMKLGLRNWGEDTPRGRARKRAIEQHEQMIRLLLVASGADPEGNVPNPEFAQVQQELDEAVQRLQALATEVDLLREATAAEAKRLAELKEGYAQLAIKNQRLTEAIDARKRALESLQTQDDLRNRLRADPPIRRVGEASVPPHPTDPNIVVVALIGCVLGLGVAIGLILLLDLLQGTFKTVDDVERGLQLPVLGGLAHLETAEERLAAGRSRRRAAAAAFGFVGLVVVVLTIFYVAPTRLPPVVRDLLTLLLGS